MLLLNLISLSYAPSSVPYRILGIIYAPEAYTRMLQPPLDLSLLRRERLLQIQGIGSGSNSSPPAQVFISLSTAFFIDMNANRWISPVSFLDRFLLPVSIMSGGILLPNITDTTISSQYHGSGVKAT